MKIADLKTLQEESSTHNPLIKKHVFIRKGTIPSLMQFAQCALASGQSVEAHSHESMYEIFYIEKGRGRMIVNGKPIALRPGVCVTVEPKETHVLTNTGTTNLEFLVLSLQN